MRRSSVALFTALCGALLGAALPVSCSQDPCVRVCEERRAGGCVPLTYLQMPCPDECDTSRALAVDRGCLDEFEGYQGCVDELSDPCDGEATKACSGSLEALTGCYQEAL
ncbi:MAG: hypothetical protein KC636_04760 [Myxococcales bacterium]|nr:hypothetical protein [Myxococcales bacterium]